MLFQSRMLGFTLFLLVLTGDSAQTRLLANASEQDRAVLITLYNATGGDDWVESTGWKSAPRLQDGFNDDPCSPPIWVGVGCDLQSRVQVLDLGRNGLVGGIPPELADLTQLETLDLRSNLLSGPIPAQLEDLTNLEQLCLFNNQLTGRIPVQLGNLAKLISLDLASNQLAESIPPALGNLTSLTSLNLRANRLSGTIPPELGNLVNLESLRLRNNRLSGSIPVQLANLVNLKILWIGTNGLIGRIPSQIGNMAALEFLSLPGNRLSGTIPAELGNLAGLEILNLSSNRLSGPIPARLGDLANLEFLGLNSNQLSGSIPSGLSSLAGLEQLNLSRNQLSGVIPPGLGGLPDLLLLNLRDNLLSGSIPPELASLTDLELLDLGGNRLTGAIPSGLGQLENLVFLKLAGNRLGGQIPSEIATLPNGVLDVRGNLLDSVEDGMTAELNLAQRGAALWDSLQKVVGVYPQLAIGGGFEVVLMVSSQSMLPWTGRVHLDGGLWPTQRPWQLDGQDMTGESSFEVDLEPRATRRLVLSSTAEIAVNGWISLRAEGDSRRQDVAAAFFYNLSGDSGLSDSTGVGPSVLGDRFFFPVQQSETPATVLTGVAVRSVTDPLTLLLVDDQGQLVDETTLSADQAILVGELFPDQPADFVGSIEVSSGFPFYLLVVRVEVTQSSGVQLTSIPATLVP